jgi:hypothetical protein
MIPIGYMLKNVTSPAPEWMKAPAVTAVHSLSNCVSSDFADYIPLWKHNGWWLFDSQHAVEEAAASVGIPTEQLSLFYYEAHHQQYDEHSQCWQAIVPEDKVPTDVVPPKSATLNGFDVVTSYLGTSPECSPLSCNALAAELPVNEHCLFDSFQVAIDALVSGEFKGAEPGPYRIIAVYEVNQG